MENNQNNSYYQKNEQGRKNYNDFKTYEQENNNNTQQQGNWRSKGLEGVNYPEQRSQVYQKKNFTDTNSNYNSYKNNNYNNSSQNYNNNYR